jgi:hypothetical protein
MIVDVIPVFYDTERLIRIVKPTNEDQMVAINRVGDPNSYDLTQGEYGVVITTGPAYASRRQEAYVALKGIQESMPNAPIGDLIASQVDSPVAELAAKRIRATYPPEVLAATGENDGARVAPQELVDQLRIKLTQAEMQMKTQELEKQEMEVKLRTLEDKSALELAKMDNATIQERERLDYERRKTEMEFQLKMIEIELKQRQMALAEAHMQIKAAEAADRVNSAASHHTISMNSRISRVFLTHF